MMNIKIHWHDDNHELFECSNVKVCVDILRMRLTNGKNMNIPLCFVRKFSIADVQEATS